MERQERSRKLAIFTTETFRKDKDMDLAQNGILMRMNFMMLSMYVEKSSQNRMGNKFYQTD